MELPEDLLAEILCRLPPRSLAASQCVCKEWRSRRLLRADLLPLSLAGLFIHYNDLRFPDFFSRPSLTPTISGKFDFLPVEEELHSIYAITDHCNGLLMLPNVVVNPVTRRWTHLPPLPFAKLDEGFFEEQFIVFDPTLSSHYDVFNIPFVSIRQYVVNRMDPVLKESEWPPSPLVLRVFSSMTGRWEERPFIRKGDAAGTVADAQNRWRGGNRYGNVYWRGALYVNTNCTMRISLSDGKYQVIQHPVIYTSDRRPNVFIGKSEKGVYLASIGGIDCCLSIWVLNESCGHFEWVLKHKNNIMPLLLRLNRKQLHGPWILQDTNYHLYSQKFPGDWDLDDWDYDPSNFNSPNGNVEPLVENNFEWDSDDDDDDDDDGISDNHDGIAYYKNELKFLGFHPYKEVVFFSSLTIKGLAYHLNSSKLQPLGNLSPKDYEHFSRDEDILRAFPYTPC
uniref:F-box domain-containing protein n=1 Tax=Leersia perrieri TaxID=77586 RepID=A0A0D9VWY1_9ORYZ